jgi:hypothetical protein
MTVSVLPHARSEIAHVRLEVMLLAFFGLYPRRFLQVSPLAPGEIDSRAHLACRAGILVRRLVSNPMHMFSCYIGRFRCDLVSYLCFDMLSDFSITLNFDLSATILACPCLLAIDHCAQLHMSTLFFTLGVSQLHLHDCNISLPSFSFIAPFCSGACARTSFKIMRAACLLLLSEFCAVLL